MSLLDKSNDVTEISTYGCFHDLFMGCEGLTSGPDLPATTLAEECYTNLFNGCTNLTIAPSLPATSLKRMCYAHMFEGCTSLQNAPELPATYLEDGCYQWMFYGCTGLENAPVLIAESLPTNCYGGMFSGCSSLSSVKCLATERSGMYSTDGWLDGTSSTGTFIKAANTTIWEQGYNGIPWGWTIQVDEGTPVTASNYLTFTSEGTTRLSMTDGLNTSPIVYYSTDTENWTLWDFSELSFSSNSPLYLCGDNLSGFNWGNYESDCNIFSASGDPFYVDGDIMSLIQKNAHILSIPNAGFTFLFSGCSLLKRAPSLPATTLGSNCYLWMFKNCTGLESAPELPATELIFGCYYGMFEGCTSLNYIKCLATDISATDCTNIWLSGVPAQGTFIKSAQMNDWPSGVSGIPEGWTVVSE